MESARGTGMKKKTKNALLIKKKRGEFTNYMIMFLFVFVFMLFSTCLLRRNIALSTVKETEECLKAATLAGATADLQEYGRSHNIVINDYDKSYTDFKESLINSMDLDNNFTPYKTDIIKSAINIDEYTIYNMRGDMVECVSYMNGAASPSISSGSLGSIYTPSDILVTKSMVYANISFQVHGFIAEKSIMGTVFDMGDIQVNKTCCADIDTN